MKNSLPPTKTSLKLGLCIALLSALVLLPVQSLLAQVNLDNEPLIDSGIGAINFITSPPRIELEGAPGSTLQSEVRITNVTEEPRSYEMQVFDFIVADDGSTPIVVSEQTSGRWSGASWTTVTPQQFSLAPNESEIVSVIVQIPQDGLPGGHYAMITQNPLRETEQTLINQGIEDVGSASEIIPRVGTLMYITVEGDIHEEALVRNFKAPYLVEFGPVPFSYIVENQSDIHIRPQATITVRNIFGQVKEVITVEPKNIFPLANREFEADWDTYWGLGPYTATLDVAYGSSGNTVRSSLRFWVVPYRVILAILVLLGAGMAIGISVKRHMHHRNDLKSKQIEILEDKVKSLEQELQEK